MDDDLMEPFFLRGKKIPIVGDKWSSYHYRKGVKNRLTAWHSVHSFSSLLIGTFGTWAGAEASNERWDQCVVFIGICVLAWLAFTISNDKLWKLYREIEGG